MVNRVHGQLDGEQADEQAEGQDRRPPAPSTAGRDGDAGHGQKQNTEQDRRGFMVGVPGRAGRVRRHDGESGDQQDHEDREVRATHAGRPDATPSISRWSSSIHLRCPK
jgi:hypothetical protein